MALENRDHSVKQMIYFWYSSEKHLLFILQGNLGTLDISTRAYTTMMRSHTASIRSVAVDPYRKHIATVSEDHTIRVWDSETLQQVTICMPAH